MAWHIIKATFSGVTPDESYRKWHDHGWWWSQHIQLDETMCTIGTRVILTGVKLCRGLCFMPIQKFIQMTPKIPSTNLSLWQLQSESIKSIHLNCPGFFTIAFFINNFQPYPFQYAFLHFWYHFHDLMFHAWLHRRQTIGWSAKWLAPKKLIENTC